MYENGLRVKGYEKKRLHKQKLKKRFLFQIRGYRRYKSYEDYLANHRNPWKQNTYPDQKYWEMIYVSGRRRYAKRETNRKLRRYFIDQIQQECYEELPAYHGSDYRKFFDYLHTIW